MTATSEARRSGDDAHLGEARPEVDAIALSADDNVATVLRPVEAAESLRVRCGAVVRAVEAREPIPLCHKISLAPIAASALVLKYGHPIGRATGAIGAGSHVHVHNMQSSRGRGGA